MTAQAVQKMDPPQSTALTPMEMLDRAVQNGATPEALKTLMDLQERWEKNTARKAFNVAIAAAKEEIPPILRNATGHNNKKYADFAQIASVVEPILAKHGLGFRFRSESTDRITVTCIIFHREGHSEETALSGPPDASGNKNAVQAIGSTSTYLQRYTLMLALGLAATNDDDAKAAGAGEAISQSQLDALIAAADEVGADKEKLCQYLKIEGLALLPANRYAEAMSAIEAKRKKAAGK